MVTTQTKQTPSSKQTAKDTRPQAIVGGLKPFQKYLPSGMIFPKRDFKKKGRYDMVWLGTTQ